MGARWGWLVQGCYDPPAQGCGVSTEGKEGYFLISLAAFFNHSDSVSALVRETFHFFGLFSLKLLCMSNLSWFNGLLYFPALEPLNTFSFKLGSLKNDHLIHLFRKHKDTNLGQKRDLEKSPVLNQFLASEFVS